MFLHLLVAIALGAYAVRLRGALTQ